MNDYRSLEHEIKATLDEGAPMLPPNHLLHTFEFNARRSRRLPRWLALIKEPTMRTDNHLAVGSPTVRVIAVMAATMLLAVALAAAGAGAQRLLAADGPIVVAQDASGAYETIGEAVAAAQDGDEILVRPGTYTEAVVIEADIEVRGDGPVEDIVVTAPVHGPEAPTHSEFQTEPYAVLLSESSAVLSGLTFAGEPSTVIVSGGAPTVEGNVFDDVAWPFPERGTTQDGSSIVATSGSTAHIVDNELVDGGSIAVFGDASPLIEGNRLDGGPLIYLREHGVDTIVRGNEISGTAVRAIGLSGPAYAVIEDNVIRDAGTEGIRVGRNSGAAGYEPLLRNNTIEGTNTGINVTRGGAPTVEGNVLSGNDIGIYAAESSGTYADNVVEGNGRGLILSNGSPTLKGNTVQGNEVGLAALGSETTLVLTDNVICDNDVNVKLSETTPPLEYDEGNEICQDAPAE